MVQTKIETLLHIELEGNAATIVTLSVVFGITMFLLVVSVAAYFVYNCKVTKPKEKKVCFIQSSLIIDDSNSEVECHGESPESGPHGVGTHSAGTFFVQILS